MAQVSGGIETDIDYSADSSSLNIFIQTAYLFGNAKVKYGTMELEADRVTINLANGTVTAIGTEDSTGKVIGKPVFKEGPSTYNADEIIYNYYTKKGIIKGIVTQQGDGYIIGKVVKKTPENEFFIKDAIYTTCNLENPHFGIRSGKLKMAPEKYVISGPFNMELNNVPTPLGFPLGLFPISNKRSSGIIVPTYGESRERGFFLRDGGVYLAMSDYVGLKLMGEIYSLGGWGFSADANYKKRYSFGGNMNFSYRKRITENNDLTESIGTDFWLRWSHSPETRGPGRFSANVNAGSSSFNRNNAIDVSRAISPAFNSNISYSRTFGQTANLGFNLRHNQNTLTNIVNILPEANLAINRIYPFKGPNTKKNNPITDINLSYNVRASGEITNTPRASSFPFPTIAQLENQASDVEPDTLEFFSNLGTLIGEMDYGAVHRIPLSTNITLLKHFTMAPSINYTEYWYPVKYDYTWDQTRKAVRVDTLSNFGRAYDFNFSTGLATRFYMFFNFKGGAAIRHMITPTLSYSVRPDFSDPSFDFFQEVQVNERGDSRRVSRFQGSRIGGPGQGRSQSIGFGLDNQVEMKVRTKNDSTTQFKKFTIFQNISIRSSYNFVADSFNLANFSLAARTEVFKESIFPLNIQISGTLDPYTYVAVARDEVTGKVTRDRRTPEFAWNTGNGIGSLTNARIAVSTRFQPGKMKKKGQENTGEAGAGAGGDIPDASMIDATDPNLDEMTRLELQDLQANPHKYVDFKIPWTLNVNYNLGYNANGLRDATITQTLNFTGDISITEKWKFGFRSGYDFERKDFSLTSFSLFRDLHCWQMNLNWTPFGIRQEYSIDISVKSSILQDLKVNKRNSFFDR